MIVAPLSANSLAKFSNGICDNLITCIYRAWEFANKPIVVSYTIITTTTTTTTTTNNNNNNNNNNININNN